MEKTTLKLTNQMSVFEMFKLAEHVLSESEKRTFWNVDFNIKLSILEKHFNLDLSELSV